MLSSKTKKLVAGVLLTAAFATAAEQAYAQIDWSPFISAAPALSTVAAGGGAGLVTVAAGASAPAWVPIALGVAAATIVIGGAIVMYDKLSPTGKTTVNVQTATLSAQANPDIKTTNSVPVTSRQPINFQLMKSGAPNGYLWYDLSDCDPGTHCLSTNANVSPAFNMFSQRLKDYLKTYYDMNVIVVQTWKGTSGGYCDPNSASAYYSGPTGWCVSVQSTNGTGTLPSNSYIWTSGTTGSVQMMFKQAAGTPIECDATTSYYDYAVNSCISKTANQATAASLNDGFCNVSFSDSGTPVFNPFDPDCQRLKGNAALVISTGSSNTAPQVTVTDPNTGEQLIVARPATSAQGNPGAVQISDKLADPANNLTKTKSVSLNPPTTATKAPAVGGTSEAVVPGTGTGAGTTPIPNVTVSNWPGIMNVQGQVEVTGTVSCSNCTAAGGGSTTVNFPETMKIDAEGHGVQDVPNAAERAAALEATGSTWLDGLKNKLNPFATVNLPAHSSSCPAIDISWHVWNLNMDLHDNSMCDWLEQSWFKSFVQSAFVLVYTIAAIFIVLGA